MVIVVPAFAAGQQRHPPGVAGVVLGLKAPRAEHVGGGVHQPGGVQADDDAQEGSPKNHGDGTEHAAAGRRERSAQSQLQQADHGQRDPVEFA